MRTVFALLFALGAVAQHTSEQAEAAISDPAAECTVYGYQPVTNALASFPPIWKNASILPTDTTAAAKWASIQGSVPNIAPKNISITIPISVGAANYSATDPDCWWSYHQCTTPKAQGVPADVAFVPEPNTLGYGFDDGPNCTHNVFYDFLASQNQTATMFYIGSNVLDWPLEAQRAIADGHEICVHTWSHPYMTSLTSENAFAELYYTAQAIKLVTGVTPTCWRPPYGDVDDRIRAIAHGLGLQTILWKYDSNDWQVGSNPNITTTYVDGQYEQMLTDAANGAFNTAGTIILTHELNNYTMSEAIKFYPQIRKAFANVVPVSVALNITHPYVEQNYTLPSFSQYVADHPNINATNAVKKSSARTDASALGHGLLALAAGTVGLGLFVL